MSTASDIIKSATGVYDHMKPIIWVDCEMTGLDHEKDHIIEICCLITDKNLKVLDKAGYESVIHYPKSEMDSMNKWCIDHHGSSGLTKKVIESEKTKDLVENQLLNYIKKFVSPNVGILAGNSIHMDRLFMLKEMPKVINYLMYRIIDVSSIMEFCKRHNPKVEALMPPKIGAHTAKQDIIESINQLKYYRDVYLKDSDEIDEEVIREKWAGKDINGNPLERNTRKRKI
ncbi:RNA exonuclease [Brettanomyces nanus]|uniref:RNA exonuclease n=1 Tax=Eeniella nana TaxID=13502 RepID=A0A875S9F5_EENNA|nr:RNA exonuclease [Brettanomyces nanus]QPG75694.1 RNA exonuclease [Brettanomyces nanus]